MLKTSRNTLYIGLVVVAVLVVGWFVYPYLQPQPAPPLTVLYDKVPYEVSIKADTFTPRVGQTVKMSFAVKLDGQPIDLAAQKIYPHASIVSNDLSDVWFYHIDELTSPKTGVYEFEHTFSAASDYTAWIEVNNNQTIDHHGTSSDYIARFVIDNPEAETMPPAAEPFSEVAAVNFDPATSYSLKILPYTLTAGRPGTFTVVAERSDGVRVPLLPDFDHFYIIAAPEHDNFYTLDHPRLNKKGEVEAVVGPTTFPAPGQYALWIRVFPDDGSGTVTDAVEGTLILNVR